MVFVEVVVGWKLYPKVPCTKFCVLYCWCSSGQTSGSKKLVKLWKYWSQEYLLCLQSATRLERHTRSGYSLLCRSAAAASRACRPAWINKDRIQERDKKLGLNLTQKRPSDPIAILSVAKCIANAPNEKGVQIRTHTILKFQANLSPPSSPSRNTDESIHWSRNFSTPLGYSYWIELAQPLRTIFQKPT